VTPQGVKFFGQVMTEQHLPLSAKQAQRNAHARASSAVIWRFYQRAATNAAVIALKAGQAPLVVLPTGSGKSLIAADAARRALVASLHDAEEAVA